LLAERVSYLESYFSEASSAVRGHGLAGNFRVEPARQLRVAIRQEEALRIVYVDYESLARIPKQSALWYRSLIELNALVVP
jgi:beta-glucosidase